MGYWYRLMTGFMLESRMDDYLRLAPAWTPTLRGRAEQFSLTDILVPAR